MVSVRRGDCCFCGGGNALPKQAWRMVPGISVIYWNPAVFVPAIGCICLGKGEKAV